MLIIKKKSKLILLLSTAVIIIAITITAIILSAKHNGFFKALNDLGFAIAIKTLNLSEAEKLEDFEYLFSTLRDNYPMLDDYKETYGVDFVANYEYYKDLVLSTENNPQFYSAIELIINDVASCHTSLTFQRYDYIHPNCYNAETVLNTFNLRGYLNFWDDIRFDTYDLLSYSGETSLFYNDGVYITYHDTWFTDTPLKLISIDNIPALEYLSPRFDDLTGSYEIDYARDINYKSIISFYKPETGDSVDATFMTADGEIITEKIAFVTKDELIKGGLLTAEKPEELPISDDTDKKAEITLPKTDITKISPAEIWDFRVYIDHERQIGVIQIMSMSVTAEDGKILSDCIKRLNEDPEVTDIILDNRNNGGGYFETIVNYIYPYLFTTDATLNLEYTSPASDSFITETIHCEGKAINDKDVYMLSDKLTSSAADTLTALVKAHDLAVIIGDNTNGEGLAGTYYFDILPNSKIVFQYMGTEAFNPDGTNNSIHGTAPDIYLALTADSIIQRCLLGDDGHRIFEYDTMLNYDNQLLYVLGMIEKKGTA